MIYIALVVLIMAHITAARCGDFKMLIVVYVVSLIWFCSFDWGFWYGFAAALLIPVLMFASRFLWVMLRVYRLHKWSAEHRLFLGDTELRILANNYSTYEAKQIITGGYWK